MYVCMHVCVCVTCYSCHCPWYHKICSLFFLLGEIALYLMEDYGAEEKEKERGNSVSSCSKVLLSTLTFFSIASPSFILIQNCFLLLHTCMTSLFVCVDDNFWIQLVITFYCSLIVTLLESTERWLICFIVCLVR